MPRHQWQFDAIHSDGLSKAGEYKNNVQKTTLSNLVPNPKAGDPNQVAPNSPQAKPAFSISRRYSVGADSEKGSKLLLIHMLVQWSRF